MYVNRNYVNPAVKFRYPNAIELRPLKCCICPKLTPRLKNFEHENACFVHLVTNGSVKMQYSKYDSQCVEAEWEKKKFKDIDLDDMWISL